MHYEKFSDGTAKCIEDKIPYALPCGWCWVRLGTICSNIQYGLSNSAQNTGSHRLLRITDIQNGMVEWDKVPFTDVNEPEPYLLKQGDIVFARTGATVGKSFLINELPYESVFASYLIRIRLIGNLSQEYIYNFFNSKCYWEQITDKSVGVGQPNCNGTSLKELFIPLPPIKEQLRIIAVVQEQIPSINLIETQKEELQSLILNCKSKILDLAIRGKLVPQNPDDEPASVLLERIKTEKEKLVKAGKIKKDKRESVIFRGEDNSYYEKFSDGTIRCIQDDIPFVLPPGWCWERLGNVSSIARGGSPRPIDDYLTNSPEGVNWIKIGDTEKDGKYIYKTKEKIKPEGVIKSRFVRNGDFLLTNSMSFGRPYILKTDGCIHDGWLVIGEIEKAFDQDFLYYCLSSKFMFSELSKVAAGSTVQNLKSDTVKNVLFPIPPLKEQKGISKRIIELFSILTDIEGNLM